MDGLILSRCQGILCPAGRAEQALSGYPDGMSVIHAAALPSDPLEALRELSRIDGELEQLRRDRVAVARSQGATWDQIGASLGVSRQSAWEYFTRPARRMLDQQAAGPGLPEEGEAMQVADEEVARVRRRRRTHGS